MDDTPWFYDLTTDDAKEARKHIRVWVGRVLVLIGLLFTTVYYTEAYAEPMARAEGNGVVVTVYSEKCALKEVVNLPQRATWTENGKTTEGCAGIHPLGLVLLYFADKTVVPHPMQAFVPVTGV